MKLGQKIRITRESKGISLRKLAKEIGVSPSFISQVEQSKARPSIISLGKIAEVLGVNSSYLMGEESEAYSPIETVSEMKNRFALTDLHNVVIKRLVPENINNSLEPTLLSLAPGASSEAMSYPQGEDFLLVLSGEIEITLDDKPYVLREGDNIYFSSTLKHSFRNHAQEKTTKVLWVKSA